ILQPCSYGNHSSRSQQLVLAIWRFGDSAPGADARRGPNRFARLASQLGFTPISQSSNARCDLSESLSGPTSPCDSGDLPLCGGLGERGNWTLFIAWNHVSHVGDSVGWERLADVDLHPSRPCFLVLENFHRLRLTDAGHGYPLFGIVGLRLTHLSGPASSWVAEFLSWSSPEYDQLYAYERR